MKVINRREKQKQRACVFPARSINNDLVKYIPQGAIGDQEEMAQLDSEQVLCCGHEASASFAGEQWGERGDAAVHSQQEQLPDPDVQPAGGDAGLLSAGQASAIPMTHLSPNPYPNPYPDETTAETQLNSSHPEQPLV